MSLRRTLLVVQVALLPFLAGAALAADPPPVSAPAPTPKLPPAPGLPRGRLIEKVYCQEAPDETYALYLPSSYKPETRWPILYAMDARGNGKEFAELFTAVAEKLGVIVVSSYNTASDGPMEPNVKAMRAMWADTHRRFPVDDTRVYAAGFSGTVRAACMLEGFAPGTFAGIFGASGGFPFDRPPNKNTSFAFFGTAGNQDFNYYELLDLGTELGKLGLPHRIVVFDGSHQWPPAELAGEGLAWLELQSAHKGRRTADPELLDLVWRRGLERARAEEGAGHLLDALRDYQGLAADFAMSATLPPPQELPEVKSKIAALAGSEALTAARRTWEERKSRDQAYLKRAGRVLASAGGGMTTKQLVADLEIADLKAREASKDRDESLSAQRLLSTVRAQTAFYLPTRLREMNQPDRAALLLSVATEIQPDNPNTWYNLACAQAVAGWNRKALDSLHKAVAAGWNDLAQMQKDPDLERLRKEKEFQELVAEVGKKQGAGAPSSSR